MNKFNTESVVASAKYMAEQAVNGEVSPLQVFVEIKDAIKQLEDILEEVTSSAITERSKFGKERVFRNGYEVEMAEGRTTYDFKNYDGWKKAQESLKAVEEIMKNGAQTGTEALDSNGELIPPATMKFGKPYLKLTFKGDR
jgi:hypothetical protein